MRICSSEDFEKFYEPVSSSAKLIQKAKETGSFYCIDYGSIDVDLYSSWVLEGASAALEISAAPCGYTSD